MSGASLCLGDLGGAHPAGRLAHPVEIVENPLFVFSLTKKSANVFFFKEKAIFTERKGNFKQKEKAFFSLKKAIFSKGKCIFFLKEKPFFLKEKAIFF